MKLDDPSLSEKLVQLAHGGGGKLQNELVDYIVSHIQLKQIKNGVGVDALDDGATIPLDDSEWDIVITADGHTIDPIFFPGGDLGKLAACGTINDLVVMGATPLALTCVILIEEGTSFSTLDKILKSLNAEASAANVAILAGDTKVMPKGTLKGIVMTTSGIGIKPKSRQILDANCQAGAKLIITGSIADHGIALMANREGIQLESSLQSDVACLAGLIPNFGTYDGILAMKDPTRGGLASALNEWATKSKVSLWVDEEKLLVKPEVKAVADILGLDPLEVSNEGKALICVQAEKADALVSTLQKTGLGKDARIIGDVKADRPGKVFMRTPIGGTRMIEMPLGEPIPRVC
jgi:hydrogenase expression/formation protein HypE